MKRVKVSEGQITIWDLLKEKEAQDAKKETNKDVRKN